MFGSRLTVSFSNGVQYIYSIWYILGHVITIIKTETPARYMHASPLVDGSIESSYLNIMHLQQHKKQQQIVLPRQFSSSSVISFM